MTIARHGRGSWLCYGQEGNSRYREVARLNIRVASILGGIPEPKDLEILWLDEMAYELRDKDLVRRWAAEKKADA